MTIRHALLLATLGSFTAVPAVAQPAPGSDPSAALAGRSLEDLLTVEVDTVYGAARREQRVTEAPSSVTILTADDVRTFGWRTLSDALASVRGFYTTYDRNYTYVGVRGFGRPSDYNNRVLVLVNGHRFNDNVYDQALIGNEFPIDIALVDRIEIIRGPGSALYGTSAFFAVINIVLRPGGAVGGSESTFDVGSYETFRVRTSYGRRSASGADTLLSISHTSSDGQDLLYYPGFDEPITNFGLASRADGESATSLLGAFRRGRFSLQGVYSSREKTVPTGSYGTTLDDQNVTVDSRAWVDATVTGAFRGAALSGRVFADYSGYRGDYVYLPDYTRSRDTADGAWAGVEGTAAKRLGTRHQVSTGVEYRRNFRQDQESYFVDPVVSNVDARYRSNQAAVYAQDEIQLHRRLTATVGARYDWWELFGGTATPRLGLVYRTDADTAIKALFGGAYRAPTVYETYYYPDPLGRPLRPEHLRTSEIVYEQYVGGTLRLTATAYVTRATNLISQVPNDVDYYYFLNGDRADSHGVEAEAERRWSCGVLMRGSVVAQWAEDPVSGVELSNSPHHLGLVHVAVPMWSRQLTAAAESQFVGERFSSFGNHVPGGWLTNVNLTWTRPNHPLSLAARVTNVFDREYAHPVGFEFRQDVIPQDGRAVSVRATLRF
jgi:outer membrane receptor protein involved in Fe transport